jgi:hypothetical protein
VPTTASTTTTATETTTLSGANGELRVSVTTPWTTETSVRATGNGVLGRGARGAIPLHVMYEARDVRLTPGQPLTWEMTLRTGKP